MSESEAHWETVLQAPRCDFSPCVPALACPGGLFRAPLQAQARVMLGSRARGRRKSVLPLLVLGFKDGLAMTGSDF